MKKIIILAVLLVVLGGLFVYKQQVQAPTGPIGSDERSVKALAWKTFQEYLSALKRHDVEKVTALSYQVSDACKDSKQRDECFKRMDGVSEAVKDFKEDDFANVAYDDKQIIMYADWHTEETDIAFGEARKMMYFTRTASGTPQMLFLTLPQEIVYTLKGASSTPAALTAELEPRIKDSDGDVLADEVETCSWPGATKTCVKTDPNKKDTNGNGWWDSIETLFFK
ncbi:hypothetical protein KW785_02440 [Candidatus Parcubacteria bacterium]|nr:hypothetical protein [Candidatus Parcubacteria bacterium]